MKQLDIPGFIDLQVNGFLGVDFSAPDLTADSFADACRQLLQLGTAAFLPTVITSSLYLYRRNLPLMAQVLDTSEFKGRLLGLHLEGPFISSEPGAVGAHDQQHVRPPDVSLLDELLEIADGRVKMLTLAAELPGADALTKHAVARGVTVALGHQLALGDDLRRLRDAGATALTHLGNGLPNMLPRLEGNPIFEALAIDGLSVTVIADGHHLPPSVLKVFFRAKGAESVIVVSDAAPLAGLPPGRYTTLGNDVVLEPSGLLHNIEKGCKVGSSATMLQCMNHLASLKFLSLDDLLLTGFHNPLRLIGLTEKDVASNGVAMYYDDERHEFRQANEIIR